MVKRIFVVKNRIVIFTNIFAHSILLFQCSEPCTVRLPDTSVNSYLCRITPCWFKCSAGRLKSNMLAGLCPAIWVHKLQRYLIVRISTIVNSTAVFIMLCFIYILCLQTCSFFIFSLLCFIINSQQSFFDAGRRPAVINNLSDPVGTLKPAGGWMRFSNDSRARTYKLLHGKDYAIIWSCRTNSSTAVDVP